MPLRFPEEWEDLNVVLAHDWLTGMRGGEKCLELMCMGMPKAEIYTLVYQPENVSEAITSHSVTASAIERIPVFRAHFRTLLPWFPRFIESMRPPAADIQISTSHCVAKGLPPTNGTPHLCYCFTPMRYRIFYDEYFGRGRLKQMATYPLLEGLERWDRRASDRVTRFVAISEHVRRRIRHFYDRDADIVYPPVDTERCTPGDGKPGSYDLIVSALVPYKRVDVAVSAYSRLGYPLKVAGTGGEFARLQRLAGPSAEFLGWKTDADILELYRGCRFLIFPGEEDFGIVPVEAQACGKPVIAYGRGGARETVVDGRTGMYFHRQQEDDLLEAVEAAAGRSWNAAVIRAHAEQFSTQAFLDGLRASIQACRAGAAPSNLASAP